MSQCHYYNGRNWQSFMDAVLRDCSRRTSLGVLSLRKRMLS